MSAAGVKAAMREDVYRLKRHHGSEVILRSGLADDRLLPALLTAIQTGLGIYSDKQYNVLKSDYTGSSCQMTHTTLINCDSLVRVVCYSQ